MPRVLTPAQATTRVLLKCGVGGAVWAGSGNPWYGLAVFLLLIHVAQWVADLTDVTVE